MKQNTRFVKVLLILLVIVCFFIFFYYENNHLVVTEYHYRNAKISDTLNGYRIVQLSDIHNKVFGKDNQGLLKMVREQEPNMIVITGDLVDSNHTNIDAALALVAQLTTICPVYYVTGNHEYWLTNENQENLMNGLSNAGVIYLKDETKGISIGKDSFSLIGLDDNSLFNSTLQELMNADHDDFTVLLAHEPQYLQQYSKTGVDLVLTGHAHGGQFRLPFLGPLVAPDQGFFPEYTDGIHIWGDTTMIISRGLGNSVIPIRLFNDPEIVTVILESN